MPRRLAWVWSVLVLVLLAGFIPVKAQTDTPLVILLTVDDAVAPPMVEYLKRGLSWAEKQEAELVILQLNTPGGSLDSMNEVIKLIRNSSIPVVVYVAPKGAMAGSAGLWWCWQVMRPPWLRIQPSALPARWGGKGRTWPDDAG